MRHMDMDSRLAEDTDPIWLILFWMGARWWGLTTIRVFTMGDESHKVVFKSRDWQYRPRRVWYSSSAPPKNHINSKTKACALIFRKL